MQNPKLVFLIVAQLSNSGPSLLPSCGSAILQHTSSNPTLCTSSQRENSTGTLLYMALSLEVILITFVRISLTRIYSPEYT